MIGRPPISTLFPSTPLSRSLAESVKPLLGREPVFAILKGRRNYVCLHRLRAGPQPVQAHVVAPPLENGEHRLAAQQRLHRLGEGSGERRGGEEGRYRGAPYHLKKKK